MYNLYNKNKTDDLGGQKSEEGMDFYNPIGAILVELQDCPNNMSRIESNNLHLSAPPKPITLKLSGTIYSTNMYSTLFADNTSDVLSDEEIDRCLKWATIAAGAKLVILW